MGVTSQPEDICFQRASAFTFICRHLILISLSFKIISKIETLPNGGLDSINVVQLRPLSARLRIPHTTSRNIYSL